MKVLLFKDGSHQFINDQEAEDIYKYSGEGKKGLKLSRLNMHISFDSVDQIESEEEFYQRNPDKKPSSEATNYSTLPQPQENFSVEKHKRRLEKMRNGFLRGVANVRNADKVEYKDLNEDQKQMYNQMERDLKSIETQGKINERTENFIMGRDNK